MKKSRATADAIMPNIRLDTIMFLVRRLVVGRGPWNTVVSVGVMLNGEGPEARRDAGMVEESRGVLVNVATTTFLSNCVHFLVVWRRDFQSDAFVETELLELCEERWIVLYQSLATVHTNFFRSTEFEASRLDGVHQSSGVGLFVKERIEHRVV